MELENFSLLTKSETTDINGGWVLEAFMLGVAIGQFIGYCLNKYC